MATSLPQIEKRRFVRYLVKERVFAALGENFSRVGKVKDISLGGLAFEYVSAQNSTNKLTRIDIFVVSNGLHLVRIPCKRVYEVPSHSTTRHDTSPEEANITRCGVEFGSLSDHHLNQLKTLIDTYGLRCTELF